MYKDEKVCFNWKGGINPLKVFFLVSERKKGPNVLHGVTKKNRKSEPVTKTFLRSVMYLGTTVVDQAVRGASQVTSNNTGSALG